MSSHKIIKKDKSSVQNQRNIEQLAWSRFRTQINDKKCRMGSQYRFNDRAWLLSSRFEWKYFYFYLATYLNDSSSNSTPFSYAKSDIIAIEYDPDQNLMIWTKKGQ